MSTWRVNFLPEVNHAAHFAVKSSLITDILT